MTWWHRLWRRRQLEEQLDNELRFHLEQQTADLIASGHDPDEARRQARLTLGGPEQVKEHCRDARGTRWLEDLLQDVRYALRALRQRPGFAAVALATFALGIGATTVMFTIASGILLRPLPYADPERLVSLRDQVENTGWFSFAYFNFLDCQRESRSLAPMAAWRNAGGTVSEPGDAEYVSGRDISADFFSVLGISLLHGRPFLADEDRPGGTPVAIISHRLWQTRFSGSPAAVGARLVFDAKPYTVVGIAPPGFRLSEDADIFTPLGQNTAPWMQDREMHPGIRVLARLRPGVTLAEAQAELALIARNLAKQYPKSNTGHNIVVQPLHQEIVGDIRPTLWLLLNAVSLVLLIACVNVASLLLARAVSREREIAMRMALGAGRGRLVRQCLTESIVLAVCGGILGVLLAAIGTRPFLTFWPGGLPRADEIVLDWRVLSFALATSLLSGLLFGLAPALRAPRRELEGTLRAGGRTLAVSSHRTHDSFVIAEIALAVVLLVSAGILGRTLVRLLSLDPGLDIHNVLVTRVALSADALTNPPRTRAAWREVLDRVRQTPGIESVAVVDNVPLEGDDNQIGYWTTPTPPPQNQMPWSLLNLVTPDYLKVMGIPLHQGRFFTEQDRIGSETVIVIDEVLAKRVFGGRDAVGEHLSLQVLGRARVIGVIGHVAHWGLGADDRAAIREQIYVPFAQMPDPYLRGTASGMSLAIRTTLRPLNMVEAVRRQVRGATRDQAIYETRTLEQIASSTLARQRFLLLLFGIFAGLALILACIGVYGVVAYLTSQRTPEFGLRIALGATARNVMGLVLRRSIGMIFIGVCLGMAGAWIAARMLERLVAGVQPAEPLTFAIMISILVVAALLASFLPARRASRIDPMRALRQE